MQSTPDDRFVFNVVWTGGVFTYLRYFVSSLMANSGARFRFVANGCTEESLAEMRAFMATRPGRVLEVIEVCPTMESHGVALDAVLARRDDGDHFCFVDPDILARGPFLGDFVHRLESDCSAVTSGRGVWCETDVVPAGHPGVNGEYFYAADGYVFGSPHFAMYRRGPLVETMERWAVGFGTGGPDAPQRTKDRLEEVGRKYWLYDTGKIVNILLQEDGHRLDHFEHPNLLHIGGMSHYLAPPGYIEGDDGEPEPDWKNWKGVSQRFEVARFTAAVLRDLCGGRPAPEVPVGLDPSMTERLVMVRDELRHLLEAYGDRS